MLAAAIVNKLSDSLNGRSQATTSKTGNRQNSGGAGFKLPDSGTGHRADYVPPDRFLGMIGVKL